MEVTLAQMLDARESRAFRQFQLNREFGKPIISFSMNIPGPVKDTALIRRGFREGCAALEGKLPEGKLLHREFIEAVTGCEAMYVLDMEAAAVKAVTTAIEDAHGLGRLYDMDVLDEKLCKLDREQVGGGNRNCIVCGAPGRGCASRRSHSVTELQRATNAILIGHLAVQSLLEEVTATPKPGLVDSRNSGSHRDMDIHTFRTSAHALRGYFQSCALAGMETAGEAPEVTFAQLRKLGLQAEKDMFAATSGVNTHKGAIFTIGILCGAAGRLWTPEGLWQEETLFAQVSAMTRAAMEADFQKGGDTVGQRLYRDHGIRGIRGQVAEGLPAVREVSLPVYRDCLGKGMEANKAAVHSLLHLIAGVEDTNMINRGGLAGAKAGAEACEALISREFSLEDVEKLDRWFIERNLSPGGCADLLAATCFVHHLIT